MLIERDRKNTPRKIDDEWWRLEAACRGLVFEENSFDKFFPDPERNNQGAKAVCAGCPVSAECLDYAMRNNITEGTWGGLTAHERLKLRRGRTLTDREFYDSLDLDWAIEDL